MSDSMRPPTDRRSLLAALSPGQRDVTMRLGERFTAAGETLFLVGGIVRDLLLGRDLPADLDFTTSAAPDVSQRLANAAGADSIYLVGERFGTVGAVFGAAPDRVLVEITTYRREQYPDATRFPVVRFEASLADDLSRRDFTINAIAVDALTGEIVDPFGGEADIALGVLRAVGDPDERFAEDPLRLLRAARFVAQLGFRLDWETEAAMARRAADLRRISRERIFAELTKLLVGPFADFGLDALRRAGLLVEAIPELAPLNDEAELDLRGRLNREKDLWEHTLRVVRQAPPRAIVRWAALLHDAAKPLTRDVDRFGEVHFFGHERIGADRAAAALRRLKADKTTIAAVQTLVALHGRPAAYEADWTDSAVRRLALDAAEAWDDLLDLAAADVTSRREARVEQAAARVAALRERFARLQAEAELSRLKSPLDGDDLMALFDRGPGPWIKAVKAHLTDLVIDGALAPDDKATAARIAREFIEREPEQ